MASCEIYARRLELQEVVESQKKSFIRTSGVLSEMLYGFQFLINF